MKNQLNRIALVGLAALAAPACTGVEQVEDMNPGPGPDSPRVVDGLAALYVFGEGEGLDVHDVSGAEVPNDLQLDNLVTNKWLPDGGIRISGPSVITSTGVAESVFVGCVQANAVTLEVWAEPENITQNGTIFTYSKNNERNVTLGVDTTRYSAQVRVSSTDPMAPPNTYQMQGTQSVVDTAKPAAQHIVYTRDMEGAAIYVNGASAMPPPPTGGTPPTMPPPVTDQNDWSPTYQIAFGNETQGGRPWLGKIYLAAVYCKKLTAPEIAKNFSAGH